ncbi:MAG: carbohydrate kinase family protein [Alphaproteobacteria bacterium]
MIYVIGNTTVCINATLEHALNPGATNQTSAPTALDLGGNGALKAISAARCGAKISLISQTGSDLMGKFALDILRKEGIKTSGISTNLTQTQLDICLEDSNRKTNINASNKAANAYADIIPAQHLNAGTLILLSNNTSTHTDFIRWLTQARNNGAKIMLCNNPDEENNPAMTKLADILITDQQSNQPSVSQNTYLITTKNCGAGGAIAQKGNATACDITTKSNKGNTITFNIFCGYFAACIQTGLELKRALEIANNAAALSTQLSGAYSAIPYLGYLEDIIDTPDIIEK